MRNKDRVLGAYIGGAIGDAMGGPVEGSHAMRIKRLCGEIKDFLPYAQPHYKGTVGNPGGAMHADPGSVTDDSFLRAELTYFFLNTRPPRTPKMLAEFFIQYANPNYFWPPKLEPLKRIASGVSTPEEAGMTGPQGGGAAWWTPLGILFAGDPKGAAAETKKLCCIWKAPLEQDLLSCTQAGVAEGLREGATVDSMVNAILEACGPLARKLMERGVHIGREAKDRYDLIDKLYHTALMPELPKGCFDSGVTKDADGPMPLIHPCIEDTDEKYMTNSLAEQMPFAIAAFVFANGDPEIAITTAAMYGRDADSIATTVGTWVGALHGESGLPKDWVDTVCEINKVEIDIRSLAEQLYALEG